MWILALELSSQLRSVAVYNPVSDRMAGARDMGIQTTGVFELIQQALGHVGLRPEEVQQLVVGLGPGSYTGVRVAISVAQGWSLARPVQLQGIRSVECLAAQAWEEGRRGVVGFAIDAQRQEFYMAEYQLEESGWREAGPLRLVPKAMVEQALGEGLVVLGPDLKHHFPSAQELYPDARAAAKLAARRQVFQAAETLQPIYLRKTVFLKAPPPRFTV